MTDIVPHHPGRAGPDHPRRPTGASWSSRAARHRKTAVALHRAAYLLYTHRERPARSGLLIVGPSPTFLRYIAEVLPSLGETGVLAGPGGPAARGAGAGRRAAGRSQVKGRIAMAG